MRGEAENSPAKDTLPVAAAGEEGLTSQAPFIILIREDNKDRLELSAPSHPLASLQLTAFLQHPSGSGCACVGARRTLTEGIVSNPLVNGSRATLLSRKILDFHRPSDDTTYSGRFPAASQLGWKRAGSRSRSVACVGERKPMAARRFSDGMTSRHACTRKAEKPHLPGPCSMRSMSTPWRYPGGLSCFCT